MRLRKQLLIASLFTLSLPWVGCQYVQEMEESLLNGQAEALKATALAVAATVANDSALNTELSAFSTNSGARPIYLHPFYSPLVLDGYKEDWASYGYAPQIFQEQKASSKLSVFGGFRGDDTWMLFSIPSEHIQYYNPAKSIAASHRLNLHLINDDGELIQRSIVASGPGRTQTFDTHAPQNKDHRIVGVWREYANGFQIELRLPFALAERGLGFEVLPPSDHSARFSNLPNSHNRSQSTAKLESAALPKPNYSSEVLNESLAVFKRDGIRLSLASNYAARVALAGKLSSVQYSENVPWLLSLIFRFALGNKPYQDLPNPESSGYFSHTEVLQSLNGQSRSMRYTLRGHTISTISVPIKSDDRVIGAVFVEQNARSLSHFTDQAFSRLLIYSITVSFGSALALVLYASWLSLRIRTLSRSASEAISETGKITDNFRGSRLDDEVGDLSRSFAQLLSRLKEYTHYLKTLSSKLSHELRTPLAIVSSSLDNLEHENLPKQAKIYAQRAKEGTTRLSSILNSMSAASRVEQAIGSAELETIPIDELLTNLSEAYADVYARVTFGLKIQESKEGFQLLASGELLVQMLDKLVDNAADFCPKGGLIELGLYRHQNDVVITVRNEGPPLPHTMHQQLFDSMVSVREAKTTDQASNHHLGLGLYIVRLIVDFHQGSVQGYNVPDNSGVIFEIRLPSHR